MNILLTNDDGISAAGILSLQKWLTEAGHNVWMVAPKEEQSAKSHAITTRDPLRIKKVGHQAIAVSGTPADCMIIAMNEPAIMDGFKPDLVVSGINDGQNLGDDIFCSGTVAAAVEVSCYGYKAIAISLASYTNHIYDTASRVLLHLLDKGIMDYLGYREIVNINVPNIPFEEIQGYVVCQSALRRYQNIITVQQDYRGRDMYWLAGDSPLIDESEYEIDIFVINENKVSISPIKVDLNNYQKHSLMNKWLMNNG